MKSSRYLPFLAVILTVLLAACNESNFEEPVDASEDNSYYPLNVGDVWIYDIDSTIITNSGTFFKEVSGQLKEEVVEKITLGGKEQFVIHESFREDDTQPWYLNHVHTAELADNKAIRTERNLRFIKLVFPLSDGLDWDGNIYFDDNRTFDLYGEPLQLYRDYEYEMNELDTTYVVNGMSYENAVYVTHVNREAGTDKKHSYEVYAKGKGLIDKYQLFLKTQQTTNPGPWLEKAEEGLIIHKRLVSYN